MSTSELQETVSALLDPGRGILAADESTGTMAKRMEAVGASSSEESRRWYRSMLLSAPDVGNYICGVILFEETLSQKDEQGVPLPELASRQAVIPGIKVDLGKGPLPGGRGDMITYGLDGLEERLFGYKERGARFAKWRDVYSITAHNPTTLGLSANAEVLARYAAVCQSVGMVPIVEPEVLMDGEHSLEQAAEVNGQVWQSVFEALYRHGVNPEYALLKPSMVTPGRSAPRAAPEQVAQATIWVARRTVPAAVPSINFLSGGQAPEEATANLNALNQLRDKAPWQLSMSFARALQEPALKAWAGDDRNREKAQAAFLKRARLNSLALQGNYHADME